MLPSAKWAAVDEVPKGGILAWVLHTGLFPAHPWLDAEVGCVRVWFREPMPASGAEPAPLTRYLVVQDVMPFPHGTPAYAVIAALARRSSLTRSEGAGQWRPGQPLERIVVDGDMRSEEGAAWYTDLQSLSTQFAVDIHVTQRITHNAAPSLLIREWSEFSLHGGMVTGLDLAPRRAAFLDAAIRSWPDTSPGVIMAMVMAVRHARVTAGYMTYRPWIRIDKLVDDELGAGLLRKRGRRFTDAIKAHRTLWGT